MTDRERFIAIQEKMAAVEAEGRWGFRELTAEERAFWADNRERFGVPNGTPAKFTI